MLRSDESWLLLGDAHSFSMLIPKNIIKDNLPEHSSCMRYLPNSMRQFRVKFTQKSYWKSFCRN